MGHEEELPLDLTGEILSRAPPKSLVRFRAVSKQWNGLLNDKKFISNHKMMFQFILKTKSKFYSVSINDPKIEVHELTLDIPDLESDEIPTRMFDCNGFFLCEMSKGAVVWNPWYETRWIKPEVNQRRLRFYGISYESDKGRLKTLTSHPKEADPTKVCYRIHDMSSNTWKDEKLPSGGTSSAATRKCYMFSTNGVSLDGSLYCVVYYDDDDPSLDLVYFDFLKEGFFTHCGLPCGKNNDRDALVLRVFKEDRFSLLTQSHPSNKVEIWVTKNKIVKRCGGDVEWMKFMEVSSPKFPGLVQTGSKTQPSYFIDDKKLVVCSCDETGRAWIYVAVDNKLIRKIQIDSVVDPWPLHCTYFSSLISVPQGQSEEAKLQV